MPWAFRPHDPQHRFDEAAVVAPARPGVRRLRQTMRFHLRPLGVRQHDRSIQSLNHKQALAGILIFNRP